MKTCGPTVQSNSKTIGYFKSSNRPPMAVTLCPQLKLPPIIGLLNDRLQDAWVTHQSIRLHSTRTGCWQTHSCSTAKIL